MAGNSPQEIRKIQLKFLAVGAALLVGTIITVAVAVVPALDFGAHGFDTADLVIGLCIATIKASLVGLIFMHLNDEKKCIYWTFFGSLFFAAAMILIIALAEFNPITFDGLLPYGSDLPETQKDQAYDIHAHSKAMAE